VGYYTINPLKILAIIHINHDYYSQNHKLTSIIVEGCKSGQGKVQQPIEKEKEELKL